MQPAAGVPSEADDGKNGGELVVNLGERQNGWQLARDGQHANGLAINGVEPAGEVDQQPRVDNDEDIDPVGGIDEEEDRRGQAQNGQNTGSNGDGARQVEQPARPVGMNQPLTFSGNGKVWKLIPEMGFIKYTDERIIVFNIANFPINNMWLADLTTVLRVGHTLNFEAPTAPHAYANNVKVHLASFVLPLLEMEEEKEFGENEGEVELETPINEKPYSVEMEKSVISKLVEVFEKQEKLRKSLNNVCKYLTPLFHANAELLHFLGTSTRERQEFINKRRHLFFLTTDLKVMLQDPEIYTTVVQLARRVLQRGGIISVDSLYKFFLSKLWDKRIWELIKTREELIRFLLFHPWIFSITVSFVPDRQFVAVLRNLPEFDFPTIAYKIANSSPMRQEEFKAMQTAVEKLINPVPGEKTLADYPMDWEPAEGVEELPIDEQDAVAGEGDDMQGDQAVFNQEASGEEEAAAIQPESDGLITTPQSTTPAASNQSDATSEARSSSIILPPQDDPALIAAPQPTPQLIPINQSAESSERRHPKIDPEVVEAVQAILAQLAEKTPEELEERKALVRAVVRETLAEERKRKEQIEARRRRGEEDNDLTSGERVIREVAEGGGGGDDSDDHGQNVIGDREDDVVMEEEAEVPNDPADDAQLHGDLSDDEEEETALNAAARVIPPSRDQPEVREENVEGGNGNLEEEAVDPGNAPRVIPPVRFQPDMEEEERLGDLNAADGSEVAEAPTADARVIPPLRVQPYMDEDVNAVDGTDDTEASEATLDGIQLPGGLPNIHEQRIGGGNGDREEEAVDPDHAPREVPPPRDLLDMEEEERIRDGNGAQEEDEEMALAQMEGDNTGMRDGHEEVARAVSPVAAQPDAPIEQQPIKSAGRILDGQVEVDQAADLVPAPPKKKMCDLHGFTDLKVQGDKVTAFTYWKNEEPTDHEVTEFYTKRTHKKAHRHGLCLLLKARFKYGWKMYKEPQILAHFTAMDISDADIAALEKEAKGKITVKRPSDENMEFEEYYELFIKYQNTFPVEALLGIREKIGKDGIITVEILVKWEEKNNKWKKPQWKSEAIHEFKKDGYNLEGLERLVAAIMRHGCAHMLTDKIKEYLRGLKIEWDSIEQIPPTDEQLSFDKKWKEYYDAHKEVLDPTVTPRPIAVPPRPRPAPEKPQRIQPKRDATKRSSATEAQKADGTPAKRAKK